MRPSFSLESIKEKVDILDTLQSYIKVQKKGYLYWAVCPFHKEKTASFCINNMKKFFHCFGCGEHGDVFTFLQKFLNISFHEALKEVCNKNNIHLPVFQQRPEDSSLKETLKSASLEFTIGLTRSNKSLEFLKNRGISKQMIEDFSIGYCNHQSIMSLQEKGFSLLQLSASGIVNSQGICPFNNRIIFPIYNIKGEVIGFSGRVITGEVYNDEKPAKYINSRDTVFFSKTCTLYNLHKVHFVPSVIIVEGFFDVITLVQYNITNVVASLGTSVTYEHLLLLSKKYSSIVAIFDGDNAGKKAGINFCSLVLQITHSSVEYFIGVIPEKHDPDSFIREYGNEAFQRVLNNKETVEIFLWKTEVYSLKKPYTTFSYFHLKKKLIEYKNMITDKEYQDIFQQIWERKLMLFKKQFLSIFIKNTEHHTPFLSPYDGEMVFVGLLSYNQKLVEKFIEQIVCLKINNNFLKKVIDFIINLINENQVGMFHQDTDKIFEIDNSFEEDSFSQMEDNIKKNNIKESTNEDFNDVEDEKYSDNIINNIESSTGVFFEELSFCKKIQKNFPILCDEFLKHQLVMVLRQNQELCEGFIEEFIINNNQNDKNIQKSSGINNFFIEIP
jgi:DNA primase catalytic core